MKNLGVVGCIFALILIVGFNFLVFWAFQELWNWLAPLFWSTAPILTYWQAFGCSVLLSIIGSAFKTHTTKSE